MNRALLFVWPAMVVSVTTSYEAGLWTARQRAARGSGADSVSVSAVGTPIATVKGEAGVDLSATPLNTEPSGRSLDPAPPPLEEARWRVLEDDQADLRYQLKVQREAFLTLRDEVKSRSGHESDDDRRAAAQDVQYDELRRSIHEAADKITRLEAQIAAREKQAIVATVSAKRMIKMYANMPAEKAVDILKEMPDKEIADLLAQMKDAEAARFLSLFPAKRAAALTARMSPERPAAP